MFIIRKRLNVRIKSIPTVIILLFLVFAFFCCEDEGITNNIVGRWKVVSYEDYETLKKITKTHENTLSNINNGDVTIEFKSANLFSGRNVTNSFSGKYYLTENGNISIENVIWTEIYEPEWGRRFHSILQAERIIVKRDYVKIICDDNKKSINLERVSNLEH